MIPQSQYDQRPKAYHAQPIRRTAHRGWRVGAFLHFWLLLVSVAGAFGTDADRPMKQMRHSSWNEASGLSGVVYSLAQTTDGFLWIGTSTGLYRFDGVKFEPFLDDEGDQPLQDVRALLGTSDGGLWVGYRNGVAFFKRDTVTYYSEQQGLPIGRVSSLAQTSDGAIWAAITLSGGGKAGGVQQPLAGLARLSNGRWERIGPDWSYTPGSAERVLTDGSGTLWVTGGETVHFLPPGARAFQPTKIKISTWNQMCLGPDGSVWIADPAAHKLFNFPKARNRGYFTVSGEPLQGIFGIHFDRNQSLWIATDRGVFRVRPGLVGTRQVVTTQEIEEDQFRSADGLSSNETNAVLQDREGNIWVGTVNGLDRFSDRSVTQINLGHTPSDLIVGPGSQVWASQYGASPFLIPLHNSRPFPLRNWYTRTFYMDGKGVLWASMQSDATWQSRALWKDLNGRVIKVPSPSDIKGPLIDGIVEDPSGRLWVIVSGYGEYTVKDGKWAKVPVFTGKDENLAPDSEFIDALGHAWLLYYSRNTVVRIGAGGADFFTSEHGLDIGKPVAGGASGAQVWVSGTKGLGVFDGKRFKNIRAADGRLFENQSAVIPTEHDGLWLKGRERVIQIPEDQLSIFLEDHMHAVRYRSFDAATDFVAQLAPPRPSASDTGAALSGDGKLWLAVTGGVAMIDPAHLAKNDVIPPVFIRSLTAHGTSYSAYHDLVLPKSTREVSLEYTALSLTLSERDRFRYQLVGLDKNWNDAGTRRQAFYTNLEPGTYTFRVIAANNDGVWNDTGAALTFKIPPSFFQTIWFRTLTALLFALLLWTLFVIRLRRMNKQTEARLRERLIERERIARELHDTLLQGFQMLVLRFQVITDTLSPDNPATSLLEEILAHSEKVLQEGRDKVSTLRSEHESGESLAAKLRQFGRNLSTGSTTAFQLSVEGAPTDLQAVVHEGSPDDRSRSNRERVSTCDGYRGHMPAHLRQEALHFRVQRQWLRHYRRCARQREDWQTLGTCGNAGALPENRRGAAYRSRRSLRHNSGANVERSYRLFREDTTGARSLLQTYTGVIGEQGEQNAYEGP